MKNKGAIQMNFCQVFKSSLSLFLSSFFIVISLESLMKSLTSYIFIFSLTIWFGHITKCMTVWKNTKNMTMKNGKNGEG